VIGVNNRDLTTFRVDLSTAETVRPRLGAERTTVAESGVSSPEGALRMARAGYDAVLVGEAAVRSGDPAGFVAALRGAPWPG
jgi:indole-3-glycerol phosphate synthase